MEKLLRDKIKKIDLDSYIKNAAVEVWIVKQWELIN
jgi:hypothetical protein